MEQQIARWVEALTDRDDRYAYACFQDLVAASRESSAVYAYLDRFAPLLQSKSGFQRARGFGLIVENARWDTENQIEQLLDELLARIADEKPTVARQAIQAAPRLVRDKPALRARVVAALAAVQAAIKDGRN